MPCRDPLRVKHLLARLDENERLDLAKDYQARWLDRGEPAISWGDYILSREKSIAEMLWKQYNGNK